MARRSAVLAAALLLVASAAASGQSARQQQQARQLRQAESLERAGELDRALDILERLLAESPTESRAILGVERINRRHGRGEATLEVVSRAKSADPAAALPRQVELRVLADLGRMEELKAAGEAWLSVSPRSELAYREFAAMLRQNGDPAAAEDVLKRGREAIERPAALASELADLYLALGRWPEAASEWAQLLRTSPGLGWDLITFRLERLGPGTRPAAATLIDTLLSRGPDESEKMVIAVAALYAERPDQAREVAGEIVQRMNAPQRDKLFNHLARVAARRSQPVMVAWAYRQLLPFVSDESVRWQLARQIIQHDLNAADTTAALAILEEVVQSSQAGSGSHRWASAWEIRLYASQTQPQRAEGAFKRHVTLYSDDRELPSLALTVAESNVRKGRLKEADRVLNSVPVDAGNAPLAARMAAARSYLALYAGRYDDARAELEMAVAALIGEERSEALRFLGFLRDANALELDAVAAAHRARLQDRTLQAFEDLMSGLREAPVSPARPGLLLLAGELAIAAGSIDRAEPLLRGIPERYPKSGEAPVALMKLADAVVRDTRRRSEAIDLLESLILDYPESALTPIARRRLAELEQQVPRS